MVNWPCAWHNKVQPWQAGSEPGVVLLGFACDEGVRRNKGRVGAAAAPLAVRKLLANTAWHLGRPSMTAAIWPARTAISMPPTTVWRSGLPVRWIWVTSRWCWGAVTRWPSAAGAASIAIWVARAGSASSTSMPTSICA